MAYRAGLPPEWLQTEIQAELAVARNMHALMCMLSLGGLQGSTGPSQSTLDYAAADGRSTHCEEEQQSKIIMVVRSCTINLIDTALRLGSSGPAL